MARSANMSDRHGTNVAGVFRPPSTGRRTPPYDPPRVSRWPVGTAQAGDMSGRGRRIREAVRSRVVRARYEAIFAVQSGIAAGLAWFLANDVFPHSRPFFAPVAAVIVLSAGVGLRWVRALELASGVALGVVLGDAMILWIGVGPVQIGVVVALAIIAIAVFGGGGVAVPQA